MARGIINEESLPAHARASYPRIKAFGFTPVFWKDSKLADGNHRIQIRPIAQLANPREVVKYATDLKRGDVMPPVIMTNDGWLVDGNTRVEAAIKNGWTTYPHGVFVLDVNYSEATDSQRRQLKLLGASFNLTHGRGMSPSAVASIIEAIAYADTSPRELAKMLHISEATANTHLNAMKTRRRAKRLNVTLNEDVLTASHLKLFGNKEKYFSDEVFKEFITLTQDAHLTYPATNSLAKRLESTGTEQEKLSMLEVERAAYSNIIDGGMSNPSKAAKLRQSLGLLTSNVDADVFAELNPQASSLHIKTLRSAYDRLGEIMDAQVKVEQARRTQTGA